MKKIVATKKTRTPSKQKLVDAEIRKLFVELGGFGIRKEDNASEVLLAYAREWQAQWQYAEARLKDPSQQDHQDALRWRWLKTQVQEPDWDRDWPQSYRLKTGFRARFNEEGGGLSKKSTVDEAIDWEMGRDNYLKEQKKKDSNA